MNTRKEEPMAVQDKGQEVDTKVKTEDVNITSSNLSPISNICFPADTTPIAILSPLGFTFPSSPSPQATPTPDPTTLSLQEFISYSQTPSGSQTLQRNISSGDQKTKDSIFQSVMSTDLMEMLATPL